MKNEKNPGGISMLLLKLLEDGDKYGYQMIQQLEEASNHIFSLKAGTLYPLLHGLEQQNAVESYEKPAENGRARRYYHLTKEGRKLLAQKQTEWQSFSTAVNQVLGGAQYAAY